MPFLSSIKNTVLLSVLILAACGNQVKTKNTTVEIVKEETISKPADSILVGASKTKSYLPLLKGKKTAIVANPTSVIFKPNGTYTHLVDSLLSLEVDIQKVFAPEHGFRGEADAGEAVHDEVDTKTGIPLISLHGKSKKPSDAQLQNIDMVLFDIQDVGVRFYTYIATLQLVMEACAKNNIPIIVLDRPNPNGHYIDGPTMEKEHTSFLGMTTIPLVYGMSIGEYAKMIQVEEKIKVDLTVITLEHYTHSSFYSLPIRPSPNLPNDTSINLYPSLGFFEGTNVNAGRGTEAQFQQYGAPFFEKEAYDYSYTPQPNFGAKYPKHDGELCYGKELSKTPKMESVRLQWLIDAYEHTTDKKLFFNTASFTKHAGTAVLQKQIEAGLTEKEIRASWAAPIARFKKIRAKYLLYD